MTAPVQAKKLPHYAAEQCHKRAKMDFAIDEIDVSHRPGRRNHNSDIVYALDMFHMVGDPGSILEELNRVLKPQRRVIATVEHCEFANLPCLT